MALNKQAIQYSRGVTPSEAQGLARDLSQRNDEARVLVAVIDIRDSTTLMQNVEDFRDYAHFTAQFFQFVRHTVQEFGGWFDKFTGDGALVFWIIEPEVPVMFVRAIEALLAIQTNFESTYFFNIRGVAGCIPEGFGLGIGVDFGKCTLSDLSTEPIEVNGRTVAGTAGGSITVLGRPVVGAARAVAAAKKGQIVLNPQAGERIRVAVRNMEPQPTITPASLFNKDLSGNQYAYVMTSEQVEKKLADRFTETVAQVQTVKNRTITDFVDAPAAKRLSDSLTANDRSQRPSNTGPSPKGDGAK